jgi:hypothetical protein
MIIIVDAYNVLKRLHGPDVSRQQRDEYIMKLKIYAKKKNHTVLLIFDGGYSDWLTKEKYDNLLVIYSGYKESADEVIKRYLEDYQHKDILLVSADRELAEYAKGLKIVAIEPTIFNTYVTKAFERLPTDTTWAQQEVKKLTSKQDKDLDALMEEASMQIMHKSDEDEAQKKSRAKSFKVDKKERKRADKLKKL